MQSPAPSPLVGGFGKSADQWKLWRLTGQACKEKQQEARGKVGRTPEGWFGESSL